MRGLDISRREAPHEAGTARTYSYSGDGLLQSLTQGAATASFLWDLGTAPQRLLQIGDDRIVYGLGPLYAIRSDGTTLTFARDAQKSIRAELNSSGSVTGSFRYRAYGQIAQSSGASSPSYLGYAGQLTEVSGLIYMRSRWYDGATGRFLSRDQFEGEYERPISLNVYAYGSANPVLINDPTGYCGPVTPACIAAVVASPALALFLQRIGPAAASLGPKALERGYTVYQAVDKVGRVIYTGITNNFARRAAEQVAERGIRIERLSSGLNNLTQVEARAVEQLRIIETGSEGTMNRINSIAYRNPLFSDLMILAEDVLEQAANPAKPIDDILRILE